MVVGLFRVVFVVGIRDITSRRGSIPGLVTLDHIALLGISRTLRATLELIVAVLTGS